MQKRIAERLILVAIVTILFADIAMSLSGTNETTALTAPALTTPPSAPALSTAETAGSGSAGLSLAIVEARPVDKEFVSVFNSGDKAATLKGFYLQIEGPNKRAKFALPDLSILPGEEQTFIFGPGTSIADVTYFNSNESDILPDANGTVSLYDKAGRPAYSLSWNDKLY